MAGSAAVVRMAQRSARKHALMLEDVHDDELLCCCVLKVSKTPPQRALYIAPKLSPVLEDGIVQQVEDMLSLTLVQLRVAMVAVRVQPSTIRHQDAGRGLFNATARTIEPGTFIQILSKGVRFRQRGADMVEVSGHVFQKYLPVPFGNSWAEPACAGILGGAANEGDVDHANNCVIVEMQAGRNKLLAAGVTFIVAVAPVPPDAEFFVCYGDDKWAFRDQSVALHPTTTSSGKGKSPMYS